MNKKLLLVILLVLALVATFAACEEIDQPAGELQHTFSAEWSKDANNHWHKATCEHTDEIDGKAPHNFVAVPGDTRLECDVCGYSKTTAKPEPPHEHTFKTEYTADENGHWLQATCGHEVENAAPHSFVDGVCTACGWWSSASDVIFANLSKSDVWSYAVFFTDVRVNTVNVLSDELEHADIVVSGELKLSMNAKGEIFGYGYIDADGYSYKAVVNYNTVYACCDDVFIRCELDELLAQNGIDVQAYIDELNANTQQIRDYVKQMQDELFALPIDGVVVDVLWSSLIKLDEQKSTDELSVYVADIEVLRQLNQALATTTVADCANAALAELQGTPLGVLLGNDLNGLPNKVRALLSNTIASTITKLWSDGFTLHSLIIQLDELVATYYPDEKVNTLDDLVAAMGIDLEGASVETLIGLASLKSPEELWNLMHQEDVEQQISAEEIAIALTEMIEAYGDKTLYEIMLEDNAEMTADDVKALVDGMADWLDENVSIEFYVDTDNVLQQITVYVDGQMLTLKRDGELQQDYSDVLDYINENNVTAKDM